MNVVEEIKGLIGEVKQDLKTKENSIEDISGRLDSLSEKVSKIENVETIGFNDSGKGKEFLSWVLDVSKDNKESKALTSSIPADGGYTVPAEFRPELLRIIEDFGIFRRYATRIPMSGTSLNMPSLTTGVTVNWVDEANAISASQPVFSQVTLTNKKLAALVPISTELLGDSSLAMANLVVSLIGEGIAAEEDRVGFAGSTAGGDPYNGILNLTGTTAVVMAAGKTSFANVTADNLLDMTDAVSRASRRGASFILNREVFNVIRKLKDSQGNYIVQTPSGANVETIWGYPVVDVDAMPSLSDTAASKPFIIFGNPKYMYFAERENITFARSIHYAFNMDVTYIRATERVGFASGLPKAFSILETAAA